MKILIVTQYFYPENFRINDLAIELKKRGHEVSVFTGKPNYPKGEYFEGYSFKGEEDELWQGIPIYRCPLQSRKKGNFNLIRNYISFVFNGMRDIKRLYKKDFDIVYVYEVSPVTVALPAIRIKKRKHIPLIMNVQDLWPDNIMAITGIKNFFIIKILNLLVNYIYNKCDLILCASPSFVDKVKHHVHEESLVKYWPQFSTVEKKETSHEHMLFDHNKFNITFTGNIGEAQGIDLAIHAAYQLRNTKLHWNFIGDGRSKNKLEELTNKLGLKNCITFLGYVDESEIPKYLAESNAALLILKPNPVFDMTIPAKLQTYLACGVPIVGCVTGESKQVIETAQCGITSNKINVDELSNICRKFLELDTHQLKQFEQNALKFSNQYFNKESLINELEKYMEEIRI